MALAVAAALSACSGSQGGAVHVVKRGETLFRIGKAYGVSYQTLAEVNGIADPSRIEVGQRLVVPGAERAVPVRIVAPREVARRARPVEPVLPPEERPFIWPVQGGQMTSPFGPRGRGFHDGIDIVAEEGTPVYAAAAGSVAFSDELRGYGRVIILRHDGDYATVYAHNQRNLVKQGEKVKRGQKIALVGDSGRTTAPNLHFEVRIDNVARDPLAYLQPEPRLAGK